MVCRAVEVEQRIAPLEVSFLGLRGPLSVLDGDAPFAAPRTFRFDSVLSVHSRRHLLVDRVHPENEGVGQDEPGGGLVDGRQLVAEAVLDVIGVDAVVHDLEGAVETGRDRSGERVIHHESRPLFRRERIEYPVELLRVLLEARQRLLARKLAKVEGVVVERLAHYRQAEGNAVLAGLGRVPVLEVTLHDVDHVADQVARLPPGAARHYIPVLRVRDQTREVGTVTAHHAHDGVLAFGRHRVDRRDRCGAHQLTSLPRSIPETTPEYPCQCPAPRAAVVGTTMGVRLNFKSSRRPSYCGGSWSEEPSASAGSSTVKPGWSVAISNSTPPGSRK